MNIADAMIEAEAKAWDAAQWVMLNRLTTDKRNPPMKNPFRGLVKVARGHVKHRGEQECHWRYHPAPTVKGGQPC